MMYYGPPTDEDSEDDSIYDAQRNELSAYSMLTDDTDETPISSSEDEEEIEELNEALINLQRELVLLYSSETTEDRNQVNAEKKRVNLMSRIEELKLSILESILKGETPKIMLRNTRNWDNCVYDSRIYLKPIGEATNTEVNFGNPGSRNKFAMIMFTLGKVYKLLASRSYCTKREMFYQNIDKIPTQGNLDSILNDITSLLDMPLHELNIFASSKGLIYGPLEIITENSSLSCNTEGGTTIPHNVYNIVDLKCDAHLILLIEKDAVFQKLISENIVKRLGPCLLITGKGFPDINTRYLLKLLWDKLAIPIFALVDPDPWGIEIMCVYRYGSLALSHQSELLAVPSIRWLGIFPSEIEKFYNKNEPLNKKDKSKLEDLMNRPYVKSEPLIKKEIQVLMDKNYKAEIEGIEETPAYLTKLYIRFKISHNDFV